MKGSSKITNLIFRLACFLLIVTSFTCIALAKYISTTSNASNAGIANIRCSVKLQLGANDTMIPFFNTQYVINDIVMSYPQSIDFTVNNCDLKDDGTYTKEFAGVDLKYDLIFYIPKEFATISALQISKKDDKKEDVAVTQLFDLKEFIEKKTDITVNGDFSKQISVDDGKGGTELVTVNYGSLFYGEVKYNEKGEQEKIPYDETLKLVTDGNGPLKQWAGDKTTITIEDVKDSMLTKMHYVFPVYDKEPPTGGGSDPSLIQYAPLFVNKDASIKFYKITISRPEEFVLKGGERIDHNYSLRITTTGPMNGVENQQDANFGISFSEFNNKLSGLTAGKDYSMQWEGGNCTIDPIGTDGKMWTLKWNDGYTKEGVTKPDSVYIAPFTQKNYPVRVKAMFTQTNIMAHENV